MLRFFHLLLRALLLLPVFLATPSVPISEAEPTFILVDHSDSMASKTKQDEAWTDINHYYQNLDSNDEVSISYFGGDNGGDCKSEVAIVGPVVKASSTPEKTVLSASGDNPLLGAIDTIHSKHGGEPVRIVVISDFDAVCGTTKSACMAIQGYKAQYPNLDFVFESIGGNDGDSQLYKCLAAIQPVERPFRLPKIEIDLQISAGSSGGGVMKPPQSPIWILVASWLISIVCIALILLDAALLLTWFQVSTEDTEGHIESGETETNDRPTLKKITITAILATGVFAVAFVSFLVCQFLAMVWVWSSIHHWANMRFGAAFFSTILAGYLAWTAFTLWNAGMKRLSNSWIKKFNALQTKTNADAVLGVINRLENSRTRQLNAWSTSMQHHEEGLDADVKQLKSQKFDEVKSAINSIFDILQEHVRSNNYERFRESDFENMNGLIADIRRAKFIDRTHARKLREKFSSWNNFQEELLRGVIEHNEGGESPDG